MTKLKFLSKKLFFHFFIVIGIVLVIAGGAYAAFSDRSEVAGVSISVGSADIKLLKDLSWSADVSNLVDTIPGPSFQNINSTWQGDFPVKIYNNAPATINLFSTAFYETANDPADLRSEINIEIFAWQDNDGNGIVDPSELGESFGKKTIVKWKTEGFDLGQIISGEIRELVLRFSTQDLPNTKQGAQVVFDFQFDGIALE